MKKLPAIFGYLLLQILAPTSVHANPFYEAGCRNAVNENYPGRFSLETITTYCQCQSENRGKNQDQCISIISKERTMQKFSSSEEYTIGVMTAVTCGKRLGKLSNERASQLLMQSLSERNISLTLGSRVDLWQEAHKDVGEGIEWCIKNQ